MADLTEIIPPTSLEKDRRELLFEYFFRRLARFRNDRLRWAHVEEDLRAEGDKNLSTHLEGFGEEIDSWANTLLRGVWATCQLDGDCPLLDRLAETSLRDIKLPLEGSQLKQSIHTILFLDLTENKRYSSQTRAFLSSFDTDLQASEHTIVATLQNPEQALSEAEKHATSRQASKNKILRRVGIGVGAVAGGVLVGVTGGLAAPLVGAGLGSALGVLGVGGTAAGVLATGLASSGVVCGALFGAYGATSTAGMIGRYTASVADFEMLRIGQPRNDGEESLAVNICVSGWLDGVDDVTAPWTIFDLGPEFEETLALKWEVKALEELSTALGDLVKSHALKFVRAEIIRRTAFSGLLAAVPPLALLKIGQVVDNPWMKSKSLAVKTGKVLATLLLERAFGTRPVSLTGYSLGALAIYTALEQLSTLPPKQTIHLIDSVYLFGLPASLSLPNWAAIRRIASGRVVNGYCEEDWVLGVLGRATSDGGLKGNFNIAGMKPVDLQGVENLEWDVGGHLGWRANVGVCLEHLGLRVNPECVRQQKERGKRKEEKLEEKEGGGSEREEEPAEESRRRSNSP